MEKFKIKQLEILDEFHKFCEVNNLRYILAYGTALGAMRHKGYIPWDDDIDVMMPRQDYARFCQIYEKSGQYFLQTYETEDEYPLPFAKIRNSETTFVEKNVATLKMNHGIFIDVFPLDSIPSSTVKRNILLLKAQMKWIICISRMNTHASLTKKIISRITKFISINCHKNAIKLFEAKGDIPKKTKGYADLGYGLSYSKIVYSSSIFKNRTLSDFEDKKYYISAECDSMLRCFYGDYMKLPPISERLCQHETVFLDADKAHDEDLLL